MAMSSIQTASLAPPAGLGPPETSISLQSSLNQLPGLSSSHPTALCYSNVTEGGGAFTDLFCTFLWGAGLRPLLSHPASLPGLGLASCPLAQGQDWKQ
jgi:hypothetical protein